MRARGASLRTEVFIIRAGYYGAVGLVGAVRAVLVSVTVVGRRDTKRVAAAELPDVTGRETWRNMLNDKRWFSVRWRLYLQDINRSKARTAKSAHVETQRASKANSFYFTAYKWE